MPDLTLQPQQHKSPIRRVIFTTVVGFSTLCAFACGDNGVAPLPHGDGALTGKWVEPGVDTWVQLDISQSSSRVVGYYRFGSANFGNGTRLSDPVLITGTAVLPHVVLNWTTNGAAFTMDATLSADGNALTGTLGRLGQPVTSPTRFNRARQ